MDKSEQKLFEDILAEFRKVNGQLDSNKRPSFGSDVIDRLDEIANRLEVIAAQIKKLN